MCRPEEIIVEKYGDCIAGLIKYGSLVFGEPRRGSVHDFWVIVRDPGEFHFRNAAFYRTHLQRPSTPQEQIDLNRGGPNFYSLQERGVRMKLAVIGERDFVRLCRAPTMVVKGRMQKPVRVIRSTDAIERAIRDAREDGMKDAVNLLPRRFALEDFLPVLASLSYRAEIRPERKQAKIRSIIGAGRQEFERIYRPLLAACPCLHRERRWYVDVRDREERERGRGRTLARIRRCKWSPGQFRYIYRNYRSYRTPLRYIWEKIWGEVEKWRRANEKRRT